jgi:chorismate-pyruvate lyase
MAVVGARVAGKRGSVLRVALLAVMLIATPHRAGAQAAQTWTDSYESRLEILALLQTLNADILANRSATAVLEKWCADHGMAAVPKVVAHAIQDAPRRPDAEQMQRLGVTGEDEIRHRHVQLRCGTRVLSEAHNWYVPARLTPEMNRLLETTDTSFGTVVRPLSPYRRTIAVDTLWTPLERGWELRRRRCWFHRRRALAIPKELFQHRAILYTSDHQPFSEVEETYQADVLAFARK